MTSTNYLMTGENSRWSVLWLGEKKGKKVVIWNECENDLNEALRLYNMALGKRQMVTLRCDNVGFPPPKKYRPKTVSKVVKKIVKGRKRKVRVERVVMPMKKVNDAGFTWCPYCREFRKFQKVVTRKQEVSGLHNGERVTWIMPANEIPDYRCPMCDIGTSNPHVQRWNPGLVRVARRTRARRADGRSTRKRR